MGAVLLEAMVALAILSVAGIATIRLVSQSFGAVESVKSTDATVARASALLDAVSLWTMQDLDRQIGIRAVDGLSLQIERDGALYRVRVLDTARSRLLLLTTLYRREALVVPSNAQ